MTTTLRVTEVYPEITVADAHPERSQTQEVGHNRTAASKTQPKETWRSLRAQPTEAGAGLKSTAEPTEAGAEAELRSTDGEHSESE